MNYGGWPGNNEPLAMLTRRPPGFKRPGCVGGGALPRCFPEYGVSVKTDDERDESCCKQKDERHKTPDSFHVQLLNYDYYCV